MDPRPLLFIFLLPIVLLLAWIVRRFIFRSSSLFLCVVAFLATYIALFQFILCGPFINQKQVIHVPAKVTIRYDLSPTKVAFEFPDSFGFGGIQTDDADVKAHFISTGKTDADVGVEITYDFGKRRGMNLMFAYADGILFRPTTK